MPHIIIKLYPGRTEEIKKKLADIITTDVASVAQCEEKSVSVAIEEVPVADWAEKVYKPDIIDKRDMLYKKPGYNPFDNNR